ncbi:hypothetical protein [Rhodovulum sp.]|uniref:hypothetical protein n=1 Tax=Rhodovulum sp. TaxID=34009 RepID=UPI00257D8E55|nr:hypothetical protein [Rhodovulum sp.]
MTRRPIVVVLLVAVAGVLTLDLATSRPLDPFTAPPLLALCSGQASGGAHCASLPGS